MESSTNEQPTIATEDKVKEFPLRYEDQDGKEWLFKRTQSPRAFIREDGQKFSHTFVLHNYEYKGRAFYKSARRVKKVEN